MAAPKDNQFWKARSKHGRSKIFTTPKILWEAACEYFEWVKENPWYKNEAIKGGELAGQIIGVPTERAMTISGLCIFLDIEERTFRNYCNEKDYKDFFPVSTRIVAIIRTQKFEGAAAGLFNANIIARDIGLSEKNDHTSSDGSMSPKPTVIVKTQELGDEIDKLK